MKNIFKKILIWILKTESQLVLKKYKPKIVAITGSIGKTSTKDALYNVLSPFCYVRKTEKSYNSQIGLPLVVLGIPNGWNDSVLWIKNILKGLWLIIWPHEYPEWLILEVGVGRPGDMKETASWLSTDIVIITAIGQIPPHIEFFNSKKHLIEEKSLLIKTLKKTGLLVLNADDESVLEMKFKTKCRVITYGFNSEADFIASSENILYGTKDTNKKNIPLGISFKLNENGKSLPVIINGAFGINHLYASIASLAVVSEFKINILEAIDALKNYDVPKGRMRLLEGAKYSTIIDDTYNSSPFACEAALKRLQEVNTFGRKIAVLGDMLELGKHTEEAHVAIGNIAKEICTILVVVGSRAHFIKTGAQNAGMPEENIFEFFNARDAGEFVRNTIQEGDVVLIKGSQGMRMERAVEVLLKDPKKKKNLLVRQEKEWLEKY
jgi:UDP-N-acetylmuramoyl-tripeptide--D-alanyl-D-alanine ligase